MRRRLLAQEVRLQRLHPGDDEQRRGVVRGRYERGRRQPPVVARLEELQERAADLVGLHGTIQSRCSRPASRPAASSTRTAGCGCTRTAPSATTARPASTRGSTSRPAAVIVPLDGDHVWLIEQHRHPVGARFWEFPQGAWEDEPGAARRGPRPRRAGRGDRAAGRAPSSTSARLYFAYGLSRPVVRRLARDGADRGRAGARGRRRRTCGWSASRSPARGDDRARAGARRGDRRRVAPRYALIVPQPTTTSPRSRHAVCPGAAPSTGSSSSSSSRRWAPAARSPATRHGIAARAVAELDGVDLRPGAVQPGAAHRDGGGGQRLARPDGHAVAARVLGEHVERLGGRQAQPLALADGEAVVAAVAAEHAARPVDEVAGLLLEPPVAREERGLAGAGQEAQVLRVRLGRHRQPGLGGQLAHVAAWSARRAGSAAARAWPAPPRRACRSGPWPGRRPRAAARPPSGGRSGRWRAWRRPDGRRTRPSRRAARGRCSRRTGSASRPPRGRPGTGPPRRRGTPRAGRA